MKNLVSFQKGELIGVQIYQQLAEVTEDSILSKKLNEISIEEYNHSQILKELTGAEPRENQLIGKIMRLMKHILGLKKVLRMTAKGQFDAANKYQQLVNQFPVLETVAKQEQAHGDTLEKLADSL